MGAVPGLPAYRLIRLPSYPLSHFKAAPGSLSVAVAVFLYRRSKQLGEERLDCDAHVWILLHRQPQRTTVASNATGFTVLLDLCYAAELV